MKKKQFDPIQHEENYVAFLKARLESENFQANATPEEIELTKQKYEKAKFKLKMLKQKP
jgi:hypothetical protein